jgi:hypothetical protein
VNQRVYYPPAGAGPEVAEPPPRTDVLWGWTLAELDGLASAVVRNNLHWWPAGDRGDQHDTAWEGIAEHLSAATAAPSRRDLLEAGRKALAAEVRDGMRHRGARADTSNNGARFAAYWHWHSRPWPSPEDLVIERLAVRQVLAAITARQQEALQALALHDDYVAAAAALGIQPQTFRALLARARLCFNQVWYENETPPRIKRIDRRIMRRRVTDPAELAKRAKYAAAKRAARKERHEESAHDAGR